MSLETRLRPRYTVFLDKSHSRLHFAATAASLLSVCPRLKDHHCCRLVFPIGGMAEAEPLLVELFDRDFRAKEFLGQV